MIDTKPSILVVDDELSIRESFMMILSDDYKVSSAASGEAALKRIVDEKVELVFLDIRMPGMDGMETLKRIKQIDESIEVVMVTAVNDVQKAGEAILLGANNYIVKPFDVEQILSMTKALIGKKLLKDQTSTIRKEAKSRLSSLSLCGESKQISEIRGLIDKLASNDRPVLICGGAGTEKEVIARSIHAAGPKKFSPFRIFDVPQSASSDLASKALLGTGKGTFVSALSKSKGLLEEAGDGTILINNIENLPKDFQDTLAQIIDQKKFKRLGNSVFVPMSARLVLSCNLNPKEAESSNILSPALLQLFDGSIINVPLLTSRSIDIPSVANNILETVSETVLSGPKSFSVGAVGVLSNSSWPGNISQLKALIRCLCLILPFEEINARDLPINMLTRQTGILSEEDQRSVSFEHNSVVFEKELVYAVLKKVNFDIGQASNALGINKTMLASKIESLEIK